MQKPWHTQAQAPTDPADGARSAVRQRHRHLWFVLLGVSGGMTAYECFKQALFPQLSLWQSHGITVIFSSMAALVGAHFVSRRQEDAERRWRSEADARLATDQYRVLFENAIDGFFQTTPEGRYISANPALARLYGYASPEELISELNDIGTQLYVQQDRRDAFRSQLQDDQQVRDFEAQIYCKNGNTRWISENATAIRDAHGALLYYEGSVVDITERKRAQEVLLEREARYRQMFEDSLAMQWLIDPQTLRVVDANSACCAFYGYTRAEFTELSLRDISELPTRAFDDVLHQIQLTGRHSLESQHHLRSGETRDMAVYASMVVIQEQQRIFCILLDITERKIAEEQLRHLALHDTLTNLPNRLLFHDRLRSALHGNQRQKTGTAVLFVDLDNFKFVNDSMGHEAGDVLLKTIARCLKTAARTTDTVARLGGDEFTLLLEDLSSVEEAIEVAERIVGQLRQPLLIEGRTCFASASIGLVYSADPAAKPEHLLRDADTAMYEAKARGKSGYVLFTPSMSADVVERMEIETDLRFAVERGELRVHYQPLIDLETGLLSGVEALLRWEHPTRGLLSPGKFIGIAEETGLIVPIGYWALEEACRQMNTWNLAQSGLEAITLNVNLSGKQLQRTDVVECIEAILIKTTFAPQCLKLEITESVLMADTEATISTLTRLKRLGVKLAMDDFGTGYSSLSTLSLFPLDTIKIDRSFIQRLAEHEEANSVIAAIVMLSKSLNLDITGEGIETEEQVVRLQGLGCNIGQGFFFAKPLPPELLARKMAGQHSRFLPPRQIAPPKEDGETWPLAA